MPSAKTIFKAAMIVGTLDIVAAFAQFYFNTGKTPFKPVLMFIASALFGKSAFSNGDGMMLAGLLIHYCIATAFTIFFFLVIHKIKFAKETWLPTGILYGAFVWLVMNFVVLPLTNANRLPQTFPGIATGMGILIVCIGIPLAYIGRNTNRPIS